MHKNPDLFSLNHIDSNKSSSHQYQNVSEVMMRTTNYNPTPQNLPTLRTNNFSNEPSRFKVRTIFISDIHLGTPGCQASELLEFLKVFSCERLYLIGDIIDGWQLRKKWYWPQTHNDVIQKLLRCVRKGCKVVFIPGNHDEFARQFLGHSFGGIEVVEEAVHDLADGRKFWVVHGDYFDGVIQCAKWLAYAGDNLYELSLKLNRYLNSLRARMGLPYWSLSGYLKYKVKTAVNYVSSFEEAVSAEARRRGLDGVICGHIHHAEIRDIEGILYCNDGDWVESLTALVEHQDGNIELIHWAQHLKDSSNQSGSRATATPPDQSPALAKSEEEKKILI